MAKEVLLRRYTSLPALTYMLSKRVLTLLSPKLWNDNNDAYFIETYQRKTKMSSVLVACFTEATETFHHWRVFAEGSGGVCIEFDKTSLLASVEIVKPRLNMGPVTYRSIKSLEREAPRTADLPFLKRLPFSDEKEFRVISASKTASGDGGSIDVPINLGAIRKVHLGPWLPEGLVPTMKGLIQGIDGCSALKVCRTTLVNNSEWKRCGDAAV